MPTSTRGREGLVCGFLSHRSRVWCIWRTAGLHSCTGGQDRLEWKTMYRGRGVEGSAVAETVLFTLDRRCPGVCEPALPYMNTARSSTYYILIRDTE